MKAMESPIGQKWMPWLRSAALFVLGLLLVRSALAQMPPATTPQQATSVQEADEDPLGRSTPHGTVIGFIRAANDENYALAAQYLDTREKAIAAEELARQLEIVLNRGLKIDLDRINRKPEGDLKDESRPTRERIGTVTARSGKLEILLERMDRRREGPIWLFSAETLQRIPAVAGEMSKYNVEPYLPRVLVDTTIYSFPLWRWIGTILGLALAVGLGGLITRALIPLLRPLLRRITGEEDDRVLVSIKEPIRLILISFVIRLLVDFTTSIYTRQFLTRVAVVVVIIGLAWLLIKFSNIIAELGLRSLHRRRMTGKIAMWTLGRRLAKASVVVVAALLLLHRAGFDLTAILTGLGIGGLAFAFAAQKTLENLFGGVMIISDEPMRVGDFCRVADQSGTIVDIGLRSTRIRTLSRTIIAIPNGQLALENIENFSLRDKFWLRHMIGVRYETSADQLRYLLAEIRAMLYSHPMVERDEARIRFIGFGGSSLELEIFGYVRATELPEFLAIQEDILLRIMDIVAKAGTGIALPSQTTYLAKDTPRDPQKREDAAAQVRQWRERGELPFPDFRPDQVGRLRDSIEYPPPGSPHRSDPGRPEDK